MQDKQIQVLEEASQQTGTLNLSIWRAASFIHLRIHTSHIYEMFLGETLHLPVQGEELRSV